MYSQSESLRERVSIILMAAVLWYIFMSLVGGDFMFKWIYLAIRDGVPIGKAFVQEYKGILF